MLVISFLIGIIEASVHKLCRSAPEKPLVRMLISSISLSDSLNTEFLAVFLNSSILPSLLGKGIYSFFTNLLLTASSSSPGRLVAPMISTLSYEMLLAPSSCTRNSVLTLLVDSSSLSERAESKESISSMKITLGCLTLATTNNVLTIFSL
jgi:hypothetical protein